MPKGPKGEKRLADVVGNAVLVAQIATGEQKDEADNNDEKTADASAAELGRKGGKARAKKLSAERRKQIAQAAAKERWKDQSD